MGSKIRLNIYNLFDCFFIFIDKDNLEISLVVEKDTIVRFNVCFNDATIDVISVCENMGIYNLFMDLYYETPDADTIGDFETKFLKN